MLFNSFIFIFCFLPIVLLGYYGIPNRRAQLFFLLGSSIFFYAFWSAKLVFFLLFTVFLDFYIARAIFQSPGKRRKKLLLVSSITINLGILGFFKYYNLLAHTFHDVGGVWAHQSGLFPILNIVLPIGISFYTFQSMSYVIDVYRGTSNAHGDLLPFAGYVTLFPHQISGPLVRHNTIVPTLQNPQTYKFHFENFWRGCCFFILGLSKKILIADLLALIVTPLVNNMGAASNLEAIFTILGYTMQLYFDFSGYSDMAVGLGLMMNIPFPQNFNSPYKSSSITEFWQRWHISLSSWLRDYLYISLGGNRTGKWKTFRNLLLTMIIGGIWHGANWTFAVWGLFHGFWLCLERYFKSRGWNIIPNKFARWTVTFILINIGWVFFRAPTFSVAFTWLKKIFLLTPHLTWDLKLFPERHKDRFFVALIVGFLICFLSKNTWQIKMKPGFRMALMIGLLFALSLMFMGDESPFLYFQF